MKKLLSSFQKKRKIKFGLRFVRSTFSLTIGDVVLGAILGSQES